ncbi:MAG: hypothetical protein QXL94_00695 [Candidatus Parvarchaeum sp.]
MNSVTQNSINNNDQTKRSNQMTTLTLTTTDAYALAENPNCPMPILEQFAQSNDFCVRISVANNPKATPQMLDKFADEVDHDSLLSAVASHPHTSVKTQLKLFALDIPEVTRSLLESPKTSRTILREVASDEDDDAMRELLAYNRNLPIDLIIKLASDESADVRYTLITNPNVPTWLIRELQTQLLDTSTMELVDDDTGDVLEIGTAYDPSTMYPNAKCTVEDLQRVINERLSR